MLVSIHQPNFIPWYGFFEKIHRSDVFVVLDRAEYSKNNIINRSAIHLDRRYDPARWLTLPVCATSGALINEVRLARSNSATKISASLQMVYGRSLHYGRVMDCLRLSELHQVCGMADFNIILIKRICAILGINTPIVLESELGIPSCAKSTDRLVGLIKAVGGNSYLSGQGAAKYQDESVFARSGISLNYIRYHLDGLQTVCFKNGSRVYPSVISSLLLDYDDIIDRLACVGMSI